VVGQLYSSTGKQFNVIILAGGAGSRMGQASDYIPKALSKIGGRYAIDWLIEKYTPIAKKFIIGVGYHSELIKGYLKGKYPHLSIEFSEEHPNDMTSNAMSTLLCLDHADSRYGTLISFCDLLVVSSHDVVGDQLFIASSKTTGNVGTFRHTISSKGKIVEHNPPIDVPLEYAYGVLGLFAFSNTIVLKTVAYTKGRYFDKDSDLTDDIISPYCSLCPMVAEECEKVFEFGNETDIKKVRELWEKT